MTAPRLVAGIGFRHGVPAEAIVALVRRAMDQAGCGGDLVALATAADRAGEAAIREAASAFGLLPVAVDADALRAVDPRVPTRSVRIEESRGVGSLAEAAALAAAGPTGRLVLARIDDGRATCALAETKIDDSMREREKGSGRLPPPFAGEGTLRSGWGEGSAVSGEGALLSRPSLTPRGPIGPPSPAEGGGKSAVATGDAQKTTSQRARAAQIVTA